MGWNGNGNGNMEVSFRVRLSSLELIINDTTINYCMSCNLFLIREVKRKPSMDKLFYGLLANLMFLQVGK
jgi:hypothetical protein